MNNEELIQYRIAGVDIISKEMAQIPPNSITLQFHFDLNFEIKVLAEKKLVIPIISIKIRGGEKETTVLGGIKMACLFEIIDFEKKILINDKGEYAIPPNLEVAIMPITISTSRGVMYSEFKGTYLQNAILPVIMMDSFKRNDQIESEKK